MLVRLMLVLTLASPASASVSDRLSRVITVNGRSLAIELTVGNVRIQGETRHDVLVEIVRTAPTRAGLERIPVLINESASAIHIVAVQTDEGKDAAFRTDLSLRVPHDARVSSVRALEGKFTFADLRGAIAAQVERGPIDVTDLSGSVRLETTIGHITARSMRLATDGLLRLRTFNGDVRLGLAERPEHARIMALALNGTIQSTIPLTTKDTWGPRWAETTIGNGQPVISLDVVTGRIQLTVE